MNLAVVAVVLISFIFGFTAGGLTIYAHKQDFIDWLIIDYEKQLSEARTTITRLDAIVSERARANNEVKFSPIHCQSLQRNDIDWREIDFPNKGDKL